MILIYPEYVLKIYLNPKQEMKKGFLRQTMFLNEINFLKNCKNKYIIDLYYVDPDNRFIIIEKGDYTLKQALDRNLISIKQTIKFINKIRDEFEKLEIIHRDLSWHNIVYFIKTNTLKVIDFEIASYLKSDLKYIYVKHRTKKDNFQRLKKYIYTLDKK